MIEKKKFSLLLITIITLKKNSLESFCTVSAQQNPFYWTIFKILGLESTFVQITY